MRETRRAQHDERADLGLLLVHGIGDQPRGDTLARFGEPILRWIDDWLGPSDGSWIERAFVESPREEPTEPAHLVLQVDPGRPGALAGEIQSRLDAVTSTAPGGPRRDERGVAGTTELGAPQDPAAGALRETSTGENRQEWLFAESWWAPQMHRPSFATLALWLLSRGPAVILYHFGGGLRAARGWHRVPAVLTLLLAVPLSLLAQVSVAAVAILAVIPVARLREALSGLLLKITGSLGDTYTLLESPVQQAAAVTQTHRDLAWLSDRCARVVVIAHSQGAAIAVEALGKFGSGVDLLVTFGQGLRKIEELRFLTEHWKVIFSLVGFSVPLVAICALLSQYPPPGIGPEALGIARFLLIWPPAGLLLMAVIAAGLGVGLKSRLRPPSLAAGTRWIDFFSTADSVPGGPLGYPDDVVTSKRVYNTMSALGDHTSYWKNRDQFVGPLVRELDRAARGGLFPADGERLLEAISRRRPARVRALFGMRWTCGLSVVLGAVGLGLQGELQPISRRLLQPLESVPVIDNLVSIVLSAGGIVERVASWLIGPLGLRGGSGATPVGDGHAAVAALVLALIISAWYMLTLRLWKTFDDMSIRPLFQPETGGERNEKRLLGAFTLLVGFLPLGLAIALLLGVELAIVLSLIWHAAWYSPVVVVLFVVLALTSVVVTKGARAGYRRVRKILAEK